MPRIMLVQPGAVGDIIVCLPIAKYWANQGYEVFWPARKKFIKHFEQIDYVTTMVLNEEVLDSDWLRSDVIKCLRIYEEQNFLYGLNLADRGPHPTAQKPTENFEQSKYRLSRVPFYEKHYLEWTRNKDKEDNIYNKYVSESPYAFVHDTSSHNENAVLPKISLPIVRCEDFSPKYNIFDWYKVISSADEIYVTESSIWAFCDGIVNDLSENRYLLPREKMGNMTTISERWNRKYL